MIEGQVIRSTGKEYEVKTSDGKILHCVIKGNLRMLDLKSTNPVAVGDNVWVEPTEDDTVWRIATVKERRNFIIRRSINLSKQYQILVANVDNVFLMVSLTKPKTHWTFIDRFLVSAKAYGVPVVLVVNKTDLYTSPKLKDEWLYLTAVYSSIGYKVLSVSVKDATGIDELLQLATGKCNALAGNSGTGKSSLIKMLIPEAEVKIGTLSKVQTGRNTTSSTRLYFLDDTTSFIDTPGVKGFGLVNFENDNLSHYFPEIFEIGQNCAFHNCTHTHEPDCAVKIAVEEGDIAPTRYESYLDMFFDDKKKYR